MYGYIYCIMCLANNKRYIGSCKNFNRRKYQHINLLKDGKHNREIQKDYYKYGEEKFHFEIIEKIRYDNGFLEERENYWMDYYKTYIPKYGTNFGYNIVKGYRLSDEQIKDIKINMSSKNNPMYGKKHNNKTKDKIRKKLIGLKHSKETNDKKGRSGINNHRAKVDLNLGLKIKTMLLEESNETIGNKFVRIAKEVRLSKSTIERIYYGRHFISKDIGGSFKEWQK